MKKMKLKRIFLQTAALMMAVAGLYGCGRDGTVVSASGDGTDGQKTQAMGRYMEHEIPLPEGVTYASVISFQQGPEGKPFLFTKKDANGAAAFTGYLLNEDMTWEEKECGWLNGLGLSYENGRADISFGEDHKLYAVYSESEGEDTIARHYAAVMSGWDNGQEIPIPLLSETNELGYAYFPRNITALENGNLLFDSSHSIFLYDASGQQKIAEYISRDAYYFAHGSQFYILDGESKSLVRYDGSDGKETARIPVLLDGYFGVIAAEDEAGDLSVLSKEGIQIMKKGSDIWEQIIDGKRTTMGSPKYYHTGFAAGGQEDYFVLYGSMDETSKLCRYVYDADLAVEPETELTIFALYDNATIRQAVSEFQIENPNVKMDFQPLMEDGNGGVAADYIRALNTELLAGGGPDILVLDGLSEASYIEKGVLEDITGVAEAMVSSGDFLGNIADGCRVDGRIYSVPVRIGLPMTFGRTNALNEAGELASLAALVQENPVGQVFGTVDREKLLSLYADAFLGNVAGENGTVDEQRLKEFLTNMKLILDGSRILDGTRENWPDSVWGLLEKDTWLYSGEIAGFFHSEEGVSVIEQAKGELKADMISINQAYVPYGTIGINRAGRNKETAIRFVQTALSEEVQRSDFYDGFTVNENALEFLIGIERNSADAYGGYIQGTDGNTYELKMSWPSEPLRRRLAELCKTAKYNAGRNWKLKEILLEYSTGYFEGRTSLEETTEALLSKMTLYLQE